MSSILKRCLAIDRCRRRSLLTREAVNPIKAASNQLLLFHAASDSQLDRFFSSSANGLKLGCTVGHSMGCRFNPKQQPEVSRGWRECPEAALGATAHQSSTGGCVSGASVEV